VYSKPTRGDHIRVACCRAVPCVNHPLAEAQLEISHDLGQRQQTTHEPQSDASLQYVHDMELSPTASEISLFLLTPDS